MSPRPKYTNITNSARPAILLSLVLVLSFTLATPRWAESLAEGAPNSVGRGGTLPIYLQPQTLAEAEKPTVELAEGSAFWTPGPERFYGYALRDLRDYLQQMTGARHPLAAADANAKGGIVAGTFAQLPDFKPQGEAATRAMASDDPEAFVVEVQGGRLFILGKSNLGLIAGIYTLLDKLGVKWFAPGDEWTNVPELGSLVLDDKLNAASAGPSYNSRLFFPSFGVNSSVLKKGEREAAYTLWNLRNRMGGSGYVANYHNQEVIPQELFKTRPELFAVINGKRDPREIARANPEVVKIGVQTALKYLKENEGKGSYYNSFSVEPGDGVPSDEKSLAKIGNHTPTDLIFWFANQMADGVGKAGLTDKWIGVLAYSDHAGVPSFDLHPRVGVQLATNLDTSSKMTVEQRLEGFRQRKAQRLGLYDYPSMALWTRDQPGWQLNSSPLDYAANFKRWHGLGATGYMGETSDSWINSGAGHYLASRVMWDVNCDPQKELDAYYAGAFGPAATEIRAMVEDWGKRWNRPPARQVTRGEMARWHHLISVADQKLSGKANYLARVNDVKRYYLYVNHLRELAIDLKDPRVPSRAERFARMLRYVGSNRGTGAFHANALLPTLLVFLPLENLKFDPATLGPEFTRLAQNPNLPDGWEAFPFIEDAQIDEMFAAVKLPLDGQSANPAVLDPAVKVFPADAQPPAQIAFPKLHGPPSVTGPRHYLLKVVAPTPKLTFDVLAEVATGGVESRSAVVLNEHGDELKRLEFKVNTPISFDLTDVKPGLYTAVFPEFGAERLTVRGGNAFGVVRAHADTWGFNPFRPADLKAGEGYKAYFAVRPGSASLNVALAAGVVSLGFEGGDVFATAVRGSPALQKQPVDLTFAASDKPRIAYVQWQGQPQVPGEYPNGQGLVIAGATLFSPDPSYVLYESLD